jgi:hypothetical protein
VDDRERLHGQHQPDRRDDLGESRRPAQPTEDPEVHHDPEQRAVHDRDGHGRRGAEAVPGQRHLVRHDEDGQDELTRRAQFGEAVGAEHRNGTVGKVHDTRRLVLADDTEGEQRDDRSAAEAEQREEEEGAHRRVVSRA